MNMKTKTLSRADKAERHTDLIGTLRTIGEIGPGYQVVSVDSDTMATIILLESEEVLQYPIEKIFADPEA
jgi:Family of unknown function (DUF5397)